MYKALQKILSVMCKYVVCGMLTLRLFYSPALAIEGNTPLQGIAVSGRVLDEIGEPLPGATIIEKGTANGTITDEEGKYKLMVSDENATIVFSFVGYKSHEVPLNGRSVIDVSLETDLTTLGEVVVVGYGTVKKSDLTGSVSSVKSEDLVERPVPSLAQAIQGRASGVMVRTNSAAPGGGMNIVIRGTASLNNSTTPLFILNGVPVNDIDNIPVEDIESVEILKDASATAIYGSRGANGVVLVTTKKGKKGKPVLTYANRFTFESLRNDLNMMNGPEFAAIFTEWEIANGADPSEVFYNGSSETRPLPAEAGSTDWFDEIIRDGLQQNHNLSLSGGGDKSVYSASLSYLDHEGLILGGDYRRIALTLNNKYDISSWVSAGFNVILSSDRRNGSGENTGLDGLGGLSAINPATKMMPTLPIFDVEGNYQENLLPGSQNRENPVAAAREYLNRRRDLNGTGNIFLEFKPFDGFKLRASLGASLRDRKTITHIPNNTVRGRQVAGEASNFQALRKYYIQEYLATYTRQLGMHSLDLLGGFTYEEQTNESFEVIGNGFFTDAFENNNMEAAQNLEAESAKNKWQLASFISRVNYGFNDRYLLTLTGRYDGSSRFHVNNQWGFFPSVALGWRVSNESFFPQNDVISFLKFRTSWGEAGNSNIDPYSSLSTYDIANYTLGNAIVPGVGVNRLENPDFRWESTETFNIGFDVGFLNDRIDLSVEGYIKKTNDLIFESNLIETSGLSEINRNVAEIENRGIEITLNAVIMDRGDFRWSGNGNIFFNRNEITRLNGDPANDWRIGNPVGVRRGIDIDGIINDQAELDEYVDSNGNPINGAQLGDYKQVDQDGNGIINGDDQVIIFNPMPDFVYGINQDFTYKRFGLSIMIHGSHGGQVFNETKRFFTNTAVVRNNLSRDLLDNYWTPENPNAAFPALSSEVVSNIPIIEDGSFLRIQNILLSYSLPDIKGLSKASVFVSAQNVATFTNYSGLDPDVNSTGGQNPGNIGVDRASYPIPRSYTVGLTVSF